MTDNSIITQRINQSFSKLYHINEDGEPVPFVCTICDRFLKHNELKIVTIGKLLKSYEILACTTGERDIPLPLQHEYTIRGTSLTHGKACINNMILSPCGTLLLKEQGWEKDGYASCNSCKHAIEHKEMPRFAIANRYWFGSTPQCLLDLSRIELALLSPVGKFGYCFTYTGGAQLRGSLSYFKVAHESIARSLTHMEVLGLNNDIVVILYGYMTAEQKARAMKTNKVDTRRLLNAMKWLLKYNCIWQRKNIDIDKIARELQQPEILDTSKMLREETANANVEITESFEIFFPDSTLSPLTGGQRTMEEYCALVREQKNAGYNISMLCDLSRQIVRDNEDDNLENACLLQFPYGYGGMNTSRMKRNGTRSSNVSVEDYVEHLTRLSLPQFHEDLFTLMLYNLQMKQLMVTSAGWKVRHGLTAQVLGSELSKEHIDEAIVARTTQSNQTLSNSHPGKQFMSTVDTIAQYIPHTNEAASQARSKGDAIQFYFGQPSYFLTVTPDDNNNFLVQTYNWTKSVETGVAEMTNETLRHNAKDRESLRIQNPGICAFVFEIILDIVFETVIGWNRKDNIPTLTTGLFGDVSAVSCSIEEQGRGTLHAHFLIWSNTFKDLRESIHIGTRPDRRRAETTIVHIVDNLTSTSLIGSTRSHALHQLRHQCIDNRRLQPQVCSNQVLRYLRHKNGYACKKRDFLCCQSCDFRWSDTEVVCSFLKDIKGVEKLESFPDQNHPS